MYSIVLMMALSGGAESTEFGRHGCSGSSSWGCSGSGSSWGCSGSTSGGDSGCHGGHARRSHGRHHRHHGGNGCYGSQDTGCYGSSYSSGCYGSSYQGGYQGGCQGGCQGGYYQGGYYQGGGYQGGVIVNPKKEMPIEPKKEKEKEKTKTMLPSTAPATIVVTLPAEGKLKVDGYQTTSTGERRVLITPAIQVGQDFIYTLQAEIVRDGRPVVETQNITVRGGETTNAPFTFAAQGVASR